MRYSTIVPESVVWYKLIGTGSSVELSLNASTQELESTCFHSVSAHLLSGNCDTESWFVHSTRVKHTFLSADVEYFLVISAANYQSCSYYPPSWPAFTLSDVFVAIILHPPIIVPMMIR